MKKPKLLIENVYQSYNKKITLKGINLEVFEGEIVVILGPSGCGKTSLLKSIAGLIIIDEGKIKVDNKAIENLPPQNRKTAMIFQNYALFPHMTVLENIEYGLKVKNEKVEIIKEKSEKIIEIIKLKGFENRAITALSGGQQQRVAIGRAMIIEPAILLFDEPLSNLDENLRVEMRYEIKRILKSVNITSVYVTHDQNEAMALADRVVVMKDGQVEQISSPEKIYYRPISEYVARFIGHKNIFGIKVIGNYFLFFNMRIKYNGKLNMDNNIKILINSEEINIYSIYYDFDNGLIDNKLHLKGKILDIEMLTKIRRYSVQVEGKIIYVTVLNRNDRDKFYVNDFVILEFDKNSFHFLYK